MRIVLPMYWASPGGRRGEDGKNLSGPRVDDAGWDPHLGAVHGALIVLAAAGHAHGDITLHVDEFTFDDGEVVIRGTDVSRTATQTQGNECHHGKGKTEP